MASISQTIHQYTGGISQQPDEKKVPGQVVDAINVLPDVTQGLLYRPGSELVAWLSDNGTAALNSNTNGKWFHYYRDEDEQYIGQVIRRAGHSDDGKIRMWRCDPFTECQVLFGSAGESALKSYLQHLADSDIQTLTLNDYTYITNRTKRTEMSTEELTNKWLTENSVATDSDDIRPGAKVTISGIGKDLVALTDAIGKGSCFDSNTGYLIFKDPSLPPGHVEPRPTVALTGFLGLGANKSQENWDILYGKTHNPNGTPLNPYK